MLNTFIESEEDYNTFFRPAIFDSLRQILKTYRLDRGQRIYYNGDNEITDQVGSNATDNAQTNRYTDGIFRNKMYVTTEVNRHAFNSSNKNSGDVVTELPQWSDGGELPLMLVPSFEGREVVVSVTAFFNSSTGAKQFVNSMNRAREQQVVADNFSANVHMIINPEIIEFFTEVHGLLVKNDPTTPNLSDWFWGNSKFAMTTVTNAASSHGRMACPRKFNNIGLYFMEPELALAKKAEQFGKYEVTFSYKFYLQEFIGWDLFYPLNVYQDEISAKWIPKPQEKHAEQWGQKVAPEVAFGLDLTSPDRQIQMPYYLKLPAHDPWAFPQADWQQPIIQARCILKDDVNPIIGGNIFELPGYVWNERVKNYMIRRRAVIHQHLETPFLVKVFSNNTPVHSDNLYMDENGVTSLRGQGILKTTYRIVIVLDWAIRDYSDDFWNDIWLNIEDAVLVESIFPGYDWNQFDTHWINHIDQVRKDIAKGWGRFGRQMNTYMMTMNLKPFVLLEPRP